MLLYLKLITMNKILIFDNFFIIDYHINFSCKFLSISGKSLKYIIIFYFMFIIYYILIFISFPSFQTFSWRA